MENEAEEIKEGDILKINSSGYNWCLVRVIGVRIYPSVADFKRGEDLKKILPEVSENQLEHRVLKTFKDEIEKQKQIIAIEFEFVK